MFDFMQEKAPMAVAYMWMKFCLKYANATECSKKLINCFEVCDCEGIGFHQEDGMDC